MDPQKFGLFVTQAVMDMCFSGLYAGYFGNIANTVLANFFNALTDGIVDVIQTELYFTPEAQNRIKSGAIA